MKRCRVYDSLSVVTGHGLFVGVPDSVECEIPDSFTPFDVLRMHEMRRVEQLLPYDASTCYYKLFASISRLSHHS